MKERRNVPVVDDLLNRQGFFLTNIADHHVE